MVTDALSKLYMGLTAYDEEQNRELSKYVLKLSRHGVRLINSIEGGTVVTNGSESSLVS